MKVTMIQFVTALVNVWILIPLLCTSTPVRFSTKDAKCIYSNNTYSAGEKFQPEACMFCKCPKHGGRVQCGVQDCQYTTNCVRYQREENECCGRCAQVGCMHSDGKIYHPGAVISAEQCERCFCPDDGGRTQCRKVPCPELTCVNAVHDEGHCCPRCPSGSNCWLNGKVINAGDIVLETECKICQCYEGRLSSWMSTNAQPRAVCFVLTNKEKEGCGDHEMLGDQAFHRDVGGDTKPYLLHSTHAHRKKLYQTFLKQHQRRKSKPIF